MMYGGTAYYMLNTEKKKKELPNHKNVYIAVLIMNLIFLIAGTILIANI